MRKHHESLGAPGSTSQRGIQSQLVSSTILLASPTSVLSSEDGEPPGLTPETNHCQHWLLAGLALSGGTPGLRLWFHNLHRAPSSFGRTHSHPARGLSDLRASGLCARTGPRC